MRVAAGFFQRFLARSRIAAQLLFGVAFRPVDGDDYYFDITTPVLARKAMESLRPGRTVLDLGTGVVAVLGLFFWKRTGSRVISSDVNPAIVQLAAANIAHNGATFPVICSDFFAKIDEPFDVVTFNAPYVTSAVAASRDLSQERRSQWDGGLEGTRVIAVFLDRLRELSHPVVAYLGVNRMHVGQEKIVPLIEVREDLVLREIYRPHILPVDIYVVEANGKIEN